MRINKTRSAMAMSIAALTLHGSTAFAQDKNYPGSACHFADNPLAAHNKIHHRFQNASGVNQWTTCPAIHDGGNIANAQILSTHFAMTNFRLEKRSFDGLVLVGFAPDSIETIGGNSVTRITWFPGNQSGQAFANEAFAFETFLTGAIVRYQMD
jgi:hypothetical protein